MRVDGSPQSRGQRPGRRRVTPGLHGDPGAAGGHLSWTSPRAQPRWLRGRLAAVPPRKGGRGARGGGPGTSAPGPAPQPRA
jgi:hypothetical protein